MTLVFAVEYFFVGENMSVHAQYCLAKGIIILCPVYIALRNYCFRGTTVSGLGCVFLEVNRLKKPLRGSRGERDPAVEANN